MLTLYTVLTLPQLRFEVFELRVSEPMPPVLACVVLTGGNLMQDAEIQIISTAGSATGKQ